MSSGTFSHISNTLGLSFELKRIGPLAALIAALVYLLALFLSAVSNTTKNLSASFYSELLIQITCQHLLLLVGFDTLIYRKYYDTPPILVGHQWTGQVLLAVLWVSPRSSPLFSQRSKLDVGCGPSFGLPIISRARDRMWISPTSGPSVFVSFLLLIPPRLAGTTSTVLETLFLTLMERGAGR